jgi:hypothetical protein
MLKTMTITSKDIRKSEKRENLYSLTEYQVETVTINAKSIKDLFFGVQEIDIETRDLEEAAIYDFLRFDEMD